MLSIKNAVCGYRKRNKKPHIVLENLNLDVGHGMILCILGRNGIGKTTLFRTILGSLPLLGGSITLDGRELSGMSRTETARRIAYVPQSHTPPFPYTVQQVVVMGRVSHMNLYSTPSEKDMSLASEAIDMMGIRSLKDRPYTEISGGERQLALIARAIAQQSDYLIMDEPSANLDFGNQVRVMELVRKLAADGRGIIMTTHYPDQVFMADSLCAVIRDRNHCSVGRPEEVITADMLREIYGIDSRILVSTSEKGRTARSVAAYGTAEPDSGAAKRNITAE